MKTPGSRLLKIFIRNTPRAQSQPGTLCFLSNRPAVKVDQIKRFEVV